MCDITVPISSLTYQSGLSDSSSLTYHSLPSDYSNVTIVTRVPSSSVNVVTNLIKDKYTPKRIIFNGPATVVFWKDGTKTVVKRAEKDPDNRYNAFCAALAKKIFESNSKVNSIVKTGIEEK